MSIANFAKAVRTLASSCADVATLDNILTHEALLPQFGVDTPLRTAHFLSQTAHESGGFRVAVENLRYTTAARLQTVWPSRFPTEAAAQPYVDNPEGLANLVYANRLGNGPVESGDGFRFRGRGLIQITGRANYRDVGTLTGLDLESDPDQAAQPAQALLIACGTWKHLGLDRLAETASVEAYTRKINGGTVGLEDRQALFTRAKIALGIE
jgi:putative chitinase